WCRPQHIASTMETLEQQFLRRLTPVTAKQKDEVAERVATLISEFLAIHPFREGNGRVAQMMGDWVALQAGLPPINYGIDEDSEKKDAYILALHQGYDQDYAPLAQFVQGGIERSQRTMRLLKQEPPLPQ
ncbi:MAG TPA: Fic family protein, partial [Oscillatoriaceae cyanobacterium]